MPCFANAVEILARVDSCAAGDFVVDSFNHRIQKFAMTSAVSEAAPANDQQTPNDQTALSARMVYEQPKTRGRLRCAAW